MFEASLYELVSYYGNVRKLHDFVFIFPVFVDSHKTRKHYPSNLQEREKVMATWSGCLPVYTDTDINTIYLQDTNGNSSPSNSSQVVTDWVDHSLYTALCQRIDEFNKVVNMV